MIYVGIFSFLLLYLSDINDAFMGIKKLKFLFPAGAVLLCAAILAEAVINADIHPFGIRKIVCLAGAAVSFISELWCLFGALPKEDSYEKPGEKRKLCNTGVYALSRHPGIIFYGLMMLFTALGGFISAVSAGVYTLLDIGLAFFEDRVVFLERIEGYDEYKRTTPLFFPNTAVIRKVLSDRR